MAKLVHPEGVEEIALKEVDGLEIFPDEDRCRGCMPTETEWKDYCSQGICLREYDERNKGGIGD